MRPSPTERAILVATVVLGAALGGLADRPVMPPFLPVGDHAEYDATASRVLALVEPVIHAPWFGAAPPLAAAAMVAVVLLAFWAAARRAGAGIAATGVVLIALVSRNDLRTPLVLAGEPAIAAALLWAAVVALTLGSGAARPALWGGALVAAAVAVWPPVAVTAPVVIALAAVGGVGAVGLFVAGAGGGVAGLALWAARAAALAGEPVSVADVLVGGDIDRPARHPSVRLAGDDLGAPADGPGPGRGGRRCGPPATRATCAARTRPCPRHARVRAAARLAP